MKKVILSIVGVLGLVLVAGAQSEMKPVEKTEVKPSTSTQVTVSKKKSDKVILSTINRTEKVEDNNQPVVNEKEYRREKLERKMEENGNRRVNTEVRIEKNNIKK